MPLPDPSPPSAPDPQATASPPLEALRLALPAAKARLALRWVCAGRTLHAADFARKGLPLSRAEQEHVAAFVRGGLQTRVRERAASSDGTQRLVLELADGELVETVAMPVGAVCVSSQVGCAVRCRFCASGLAGVRRNLAAGEILEQVIHARREMSIDRVVFMGMGEPTHNLAAVLDAVTALKELALISPRRQTVSTVGSLRALAAMAAAPVRPALALSLHTADAGVRRDLLPHATHEPLGELVAAADAYGRSSGTPVQFEWTLLAGVNDRDADVDALCALLRGVRGYVNFIMWNPVAGLPFARPERQRAVAMVRAVKAHGILATIRDSAGPDVDAACGQLRRRVRAG